MSEKNFFIHPQGLVEEGAVIGENTRIWAWAHVLGGAEIGRDCNICDHTFIENGVKLGDRVTVKCGVSIWEGITAEDDVFIGPSVTFTNDRFPRSKLYPETYCRTHICQGASIGANATILPPTTLGNYAALAKLARIVIANDSGISHVAAAVGAKQLTLVGVTDVNRTRPWNPSAVVLGDAEKGWPSTYEVISTVKSIVGL